MVQPSLEDWRAISTSAAMAAARPSSIRRNCARLNDRMLHESPFADVRRGSRRWAWTAPTTTFWQAVRPNLSRLSDAGDWHDVCFGHIEPVIADPALHDEAAGALPEEPGTTGLAGWTEALKAATGRRGRELFRPLRLALTGGDHGPELKALLPLIGRGRRERPPARRDA